MTQKSVSFCFDIKALFITNQLSELLRVTISSEVRVVFPLSDPGASPHLTASHGSCCAWAHADLVNPPFPAKDALLSVNQRGGLERAVVLMAALPAL